jgi:hypothetical protein
MWRVKSGQKVKKTSKNGENRPKRCKIAVMANFGPLEMVLVANFFFQAILDPL